MDYIEFSCDLQGKQAFSQDVITAQLAEIGFESFTSEEKEYKAYIQEQEFNAELLKQTIESIEEYLGKIPYKTILIPTKNWNEEWESQFEPVVVENKIIIRASFHENIAKNYLYDIVIDPKMSFGTGHHETTYCMLQNMLSLDFKDKTVVDCGCGTGVLGIAAAMMGAKSVFAFDYDPICVENTDENIQRNEIKKMESALGGVSIIEGKKFDIILANINRNILVNNMHFFSKSLNSGGSLIMSGFYEKDIKIVEKSALENQLKFVSFIAKNNWSSTLFYK
jgi:ribosomal protein L11 methyltransferase